MYIFSCSFLIVHATVFPSTFFVCILSYRIRKGGWKRQLPQIPKKKFLRSLEVFFVFFEKELMCKKGNGNTFAE